MISSKPVSGKLDVAGSTPLQGLAARTADCFSTG
jgi:hypothetical protein